MDSYVIASAATVAALVAGFFAVQVSRRSVFLWL
jgi:hypothetical protein